MELRKAVAWVDRWEMIPAGCTVLCAVSGGRDSMVLLHFLYTLGLQRGFSVAAAHYNHRLRPTAERDEQFVRAWTAERNIPCRCGGGDVAAYCAANGLSVEEGARKLRYAFLEESRQELGAAVIATGHHLADQAETVLLNLIRGTGADGLRGIAPVRDRLIRPLLDTSPEELEVYAAAHGLCWVEDETNGDERYSRNRLRRQVLPELEMVNAAALENIHRAARTLAEESRWIEEEAARRLEALGDPLPWQAFREQPAVLRRRMARLLLDRLPVGKKDITAAHIEAIAELNRGGHLSLPGGIRISAENGLLTAALAEQAEKAVPLSPEEPAFWGGWTIRLRDDTTGEKTGIRVPYDGAAPLTVGRWNPKARMAVGTGRRTLKRIFADCRVPVSRRDGYPVLYAGEEPVAILPLTDGCPADCQKHKRHALIDWEFKENKGETL